MRGWLNQQEKTVQQLKQEFSKFTGNSKVPEVSKTLSLLDFQKNPLSHKLNESNNIDWYPSFRNPFSLELKNHLTGQTVEVDRKWLETDEKYWVEIANTMALFELDNYDFSRTELKDVKSINDWVGKQTEIYSKLLKFVSSAVDKFYWASIDW